MTTTPFTTGSGTPRAAIVSLAIGHEYRRRWETLCRPNWASYAERHGFDLVVSPAPLADDALAQSRSPAWQKCLILEQPWAAQYDAIIWIDSDIIIKPSAPNLLDGFPLGSGKVGGAYCGAQLSATDKIGYMSRLLQRNLTPDEARTAFGNFQRQFYLDAGVSPAYGETVSTGVLILDPKRHRDLLAETYAFRGASIVHEQPKLSSLIQSRGLLHELSPAFNYSAYDFIRAHYPALVEGENGMRFDDPVIGLAVQAAMDNAYFLHFSAMNSFLDRLNTI